MPYSSEACFVNVLFYWILHLIAAKRQRRTIVLDSAARVCPCYKRGFGTRRLLLSRGPRTTSTRRLPIAPQRSSQHLGFRSQGRTISSEANRFFSSIFSLVQKAIHCSKNCEALQEPSTLRAETLSNLWMRPHPHTV